MTQEVLKLALEGVEIHSPNSPEYIVCAALIEALREHAMREVQRLGQEIEQEPVAIKRMKEWIEYLKRKSDFGQHMKIPSEMSAGACWELAIELEQFINTTPPQRTWVELTDEQANEYNYLGPDMPWVVREVAAILKERNQ